MNWIKTSDRYPEEGIAILFFFPLNQEVFYGWFENDEEIKFIGATGIRFNDTFYQADITHWMPFPEIPLPKD